jgi:hypothetical protein
LVKDRTPQKRLTRQPIAVTKKNINTKVSPVDLTSKDDDESNTDEDAGNVKFEFSEDDDLPITAPKVIRILKQVSRILYL